MFQFGAYGGDYNTKQAIHSPRDANFGSRRYFHLSGQELTLALAVLLSQKVLGHWWVLGE
jgi:hypothetical protein